MADAKTFPEPPLLERPFLERHGVRRLLNALGMSTLVGANVVPPEVQAAVNEAMSVNVEIDELQAAASRVIAQASGTEAGCVTSSCSAGLAVMTAAAMTGADLGKILRLPDTAGMRDEVVLQFGHNLNFGGEIAQMVRLTGAKLKLIGTANHCDAFYLRDAIGPQTAAVWFVENGAVHPAGDFIPLAQCVEIASQQGVPVLVDAAGEWDVRPLVEAGASMVVTSAHKRMAATTSGMICGHKDLIRATYLQNWGIGRAMKVGKEGVAGCMAAVERWYTRDKAAEKARFRRLADIVAEHVTSRPGRWPCLVDVDVPRKKTGLTARQFANALREGDPPIWVRGAHDGPGSDGQGRERISLNLAVMDEADARTIGETIAHLIENPRPPKDDVAFHDLYWSEQRLLSWPD